MNKTLVLFDFDGTLSKKDTFFQFIYFAKGFWQTNLLLAKNSLFIFLYLIKIRSAEELKIKLLGDFFKNKTKSELIKLGNDFCEEFFRKDSFKKEIFTQLIEFKKTEATIYIVTASVGVWMHPICEKLGVNVLCTELLFENEKFTGKLATKNCNGIEKANRIKSEIELCNYSHIIAYGNSKGDFEMFKMADQTVHLK